MSRCRRCWTTSMRCSSASAATATPMAACPDRTCANVLPALPFLVQNGRIVIGDDTDGRAIAGWEDQIALPDLHGKRVVVLGGGDTGMDCVRSAIRLGAASVHLRVPPRRSQHARLRARGGQCARRRRRVPVQPPAAGADWATTRCTPCASWKHDWANPMRAAAAMRKASPAANRELDADVVIIAFGFSARSARLAGRTRYPGRSQRPHPGRQRACPTRPATRRCSPAAMASAARTWWSPQCRKGVMRRRESRHS